MTSQTAYMFFSSPTITYAAVLIRSFYHHMEELCRDVSVGGLPTSKKILVFVVAWELYITSFDVVNGLKIEISNSKVTYIYIYINTYILYIWSAPGSGPTFYEYWPIYIYICCFFFSNILLSPYPQVKFWVSSSPHLRYFTRLGRHRRPPSMCRMRSWSNACEVTWMVIPPKIIISSRKTWVCWGNLPFFRKKPENMAFFHTFFFVFVCTYFLHISFWW